MVDNFLRWRLPKDFRPDNGISYKQQTFENVMPTGTNLFTAEQAREMVHFMLTGISREEEHRKSVETVKALQEPFAELGRKQEIEELRKRIEELEMQVIALHVCGS